MEKDAIKYSPFEVCGEFVSETIKCPPHDSIKSESHDDTTTKVSYVMLTDAQGKNTDSTVKSKKERLPISELVPKIIVIMAFLAMYVSVSWSAFCESITCGLFVSGMLALIFGMFLPLIIDGDNNTTKNKETK